MAEKLAIQFTLGATLSPKFNKTFASARERFNSLGSTIRDFKSKRGLIDTLRADQKAVDKLGNELEEARRKAAYFRRQMELGGKEGAKQFGADVKKASAEVGRLSTSLKKAETRLDGTRNKMKEAGLSVRNHAKEYDRLGKAMEATRLKHARLQKHLTARDKAGQRFGAMRGRMLGMAGAAYGAGRLIGQAGEFEAAQVRLGTVINSEDMGKSIVAARKEALEFARKNLGTETEHLNIQYALNSAGLEADASRLGAAVVSQVATITSGSSEQVGEVIATVYNNLGDQLEGDTQQRLTRIGELLTKTQFKFQIRDFGQLGESLKYATPILAQYNVSLDQGVTLLGALNSAGLQGSMAGTALSATFNKMSKASEEFGFDLVRTKDGGLDFIATMENLSSAVGGFEGMDQKVIDDMQRVFGLEGVRGVTLLGKQLGELRKAQDDVAQSSKGIIDKNYQSFLNSTSGQVTLFTNNVRILGTTFAGTLLPAVNAVLKPITNFSRWLGVMTEKYPALGKVIAGLAGGLFAAGAAIGVVTAAQWLWNAAMAANPIGLIIAGVAVLGVALYSFSDMFEGWGASIFKFFQDFSEGWTQLKTIVGGVIDVFKSSFNSLIEWFRTLPEQFVTMGAAIIGGLLTGLKSKMVEVKESIMSVGSNIKGWFADKLGISSPSSVFATLGQAITQGLGIGLANTGPVRTGMMAVAGALAVPMAAAGGGPGASGIGAGADNRIYTYNFNIHQQPGQDPRALVDEIEQVMRERERRALHDG